MIPPPAVPIPPPAWSAAGRLDGVWDCGVCPAVCAADRTQVVGLRRRTAAPVEAFTVPRGCVASTRQVVG